MASFVTGVTVITTQVRGEVRGMTANAFMSGSLEPPLCVVSVGKKARMHAFLLEAGHFGVNILARGQESLIGHFAGRPVEGIDPKYEYAGDTPVFAHAISTIAAKVTARHDCGDHSLFIGHIFALRHSDGLSGRAARRQARVAPASHEQDDLADARFLVRRRILAISGETRCRGGRVGQRVRRFFVCSRELTPIRRDFPAVALAPGPRWLPYDHATYLILL